MPMGQHSSRQEKKKRIQLPSTIWSTTTLLKQSHNKNKLEKNEYLELKNKFTKKAQQQVTFS